MEGGQGPGEVDEPAGAGGPVVLLIAVFLPADGAYRDRGRLTLADLERRR